MTVKVEWGGRVYDVDPDEFTMRELGLIKERCGLGYPELVNGVLQGEGDAIRALFWLVDQRDNPKLKFADYDGPPGRVWRELMPHFGLLAVEAGKAVDVAEEMTKQAGSAGSASSTASDPSSSGD